MNPREPALRVAFLATSAELGGAERSLLTLVGALRKTGRVEPIVVVPAEGPFAQAIRELGIEPTTVTLPASLARLGSAARSTRGSAVRAAIALPSAVPYIADLRRTLRRERVSLVHSNGIKMHLLTRLVAPSGSAVVWHLRDYLDRRAFVGRVMRHLSTNTPVVAVSASVADDARRALGSRRVFVLENRIDLDEFSPDGPLLDLSSNTPERPCQIRIGLVSSFATWKGHETFLQAVARVSRDLPVRFYVIGGPIYETLGSQHDTESLRRMASTLGIADRVEFMGFVARPAEAIRALDIVVHASTEREPFGRTIVESMACGRATIVARLPRSGGWELVTEGVDAIGHCAGDAIDLAAAIVALASDPPLRAHLGRNGRATAEARFDASSLGDRVLDIYRQLGVL